MNTDKVKEMMDACYRAKRILDMQPKLPKDVLPSYIRFLEAVIELNSIKENVKISDIGDYLKIPRPGATRTISAMEGIGLLKKNAAEHDGRITYITVTDEGEKVYQKFNIEYFTELSRRLENVISMDEACTMIETIDKLYKVMEKGRNIINEQ